MTLELLWKSQLERPPSKQGNVFVFSQDKDKSHIIESVRVLENLGFQILATGGTQRYLIENGISVERVNKVLEEGTVVDSMNNNNINLVINTTEGSKALSDSKSLRQAA